MKTLRSILLGTALLGTLAATAIAAPNSVTIKMAALNGSGETGMAVLTQAGSDVDVIVHLNGQPAGVPQPTHIHVGTCGKINAAPEYPLSNTLDGKSVSKVPGVKLVDLLKGHYAINVHKSGTEIGTYVACGNIK
jgi:hypothetical protein